MDIQEVYAKNRSSKKQCTKCIYYTPSYVDDYTLRHFGYGKVKVRPACTFGGGDGFVSHNPARLCSHYEIKNKEERGRENLQRLKVFKIIQKFRLETLIKKTQKYSKDEFIKEKNGTIYK